MTKSIEQDIKSTNLLKGIAILAVVLLHTLSSLHGAYVSANFPLVVIVDQLARFCVPLFVALSGYALMAKYKTAIDLGVFFKRRVLRLLPLYLLWSVIFTVVFSGWHLNLGDPGFYWAFLHNLIYGQADYQLYFVPMIVQLYLLFPILRVLLVKFPRLTIVAAILVQLTSFVLWNQYVIFTSWIVYFVLGMWIANRKANKIGVSELSLYLGILVVGLTVSITGGLHSIGVGIDSITALRFTRFPVFVYALGFIGLSVGLRKQILALSGPLRRVIGFLGDQSYLVYLSHTLLLRIVFSLFYGEASLTSVLPMTLAFLGGLFISRYL